MLLLSLLLALWLSPAGAMAGERCDPGAQDALLARAGSESDLRRVALTDASAREEAKGALPEPEAACVGVHGEFAPQEPDIRFTWLWFAVQFLPSPELVANLADEANGLDPFALGLRWQVTPLLVSWGVREGLSRLRWFIVEPVVRHAGSFEIFASPQLLFQRENVLRNVLLRAGGRFYVPLYHVGEYLSMSVGSSYYWLDGAHGPSFEAGVYVLFGAIGLVATWSPWLERAEWIATLNLRVF